MAAFIGFCFVLAVLALCGIAFWVSQKEPEPSVSVPSGSTWTNTDPFDERLVTVDEVRTNDAGEEYVRFFLGKNKFPITLRKETFLVCYTRKS